MADTSAQMQAAAAINAGFFDRKLQNPLGAIRKDGTWISSPILNRGVIAWNDSGQFQVGRMSLSERITTSTGQTLTVTGQNSGYPQGGLSRYTPDWGRTYIPVKKDGSEQIFSVVDNRVVSHSQSNSASQFSIPANGYLLVARGLDAKTSLIPNTTIQSQGMAASPSQFDQYPHIMGAGPLLLSNNQVVLDIGAETFQRAFEAEAAPRSAIAQKPDGTLLLVTCHNRVGGAGPTLGEWARILQQMGGHHALNLDGGSSTTLYLGGRLVDRHPVTAARVQNGLGIFLNQPKQAAQ
ncbi:MAG: phosphodiester glycosidase family protein [Acaryochloridaceae cyanobacterium RL_2_7]|nr:phosphodiester glycosidase family protein [Acaryochloridaceae cyanobacterium RL_2_7]